MVPLLFELQKIRLCLFPFLCELLQGTFYVCFSLHVNYSMVTISICSFFNTKVSTLCPKVTINVRIAFFCNKQREIIALDRQGTTLQQRPESPTVTPPGVRVKYTVYKLHQRYNLKWTMSNRPGVCYSRGELNKVAENKNEALECRLRCRRQNLYTFSPFLHTPASLSTSRSAVTQLTENGPYG